jgi:hypothetical protein
MDQSRVRGRFSRCLGGVSLLAALTLPPLSRPAFGKDFTITITSTPSGAKVEIDDIEKGYTPYTMRVPPGFVKPTHSAFSKKLGTPAMLRLSMPGYITKEVALAAGPFEWKNLYGVTLATIYMLKATSFHFDLEPEPTPQVAETPNPTTAESPELVKPTHWNATFSDSVGKGTMSVSLDVRSDGTVAGTYGAKSEGMPGETHGSITGTWQGSTMKFVMLQTGPCAGSYSGALSLDRDRGSGPYSGTDCKGKHENGFIQVVYDSGASPIVSPTASSPSQPQASDQATGQPPPALTNGEIVRMVKAGLSEETILLDIQKGPDRFDTSPAALIDLKSQGVPESVLQGMLRAGSPPE